MFSRFCGGAGTPPRHDTPLPGRRARKDSSGALKVPSRCPQKLISMLMSWAQEAVCSTNAWPRLDASHSVTRLRNFSALAYHVNDSPLPLKRGILTVDCAPKGVKNHSQHPFLNGRRVALPMSKRSTYYTEGRPRGSQKRARTFVLRRDGCRAQANKICF